MTHIVKLLQNHHIMCKRHCQQLEELYTSYQLNAQISLFI